MEDTIILWILLILFIIGVYNFFEPRIDIIQIGPNKKEVLLWYNHIKDGEVYRRWIKLF